MALGLVSALVITSMVVLLPGRQTSLETALPTVVRLPLWLSSAAFFVGLLAGFLHALPGVVASSAPRAVSSPTLYVTWKAGALVADSLGIGVAPAPIGLSLVLGTAVVTVVALSTALVRVRSGAGGWPSSRRKAEPSAFLHDGQPMPTREEQAMRITDATAGPSATIVRQRQRLAATTTVPGRAGRVRPNGLRLRWQPTPSGLDSRWESA